MDNRPIGVFDSGIGGLTAVKELIKILPNEDLIYFGDTARVPYGTHSADTIIKYAKQDLKFMLDMNVKAVLIACGTISSTSMQELRTMTKIPLVGVIEPAAEKAVKSGNRILVLATSATISSHSYLDTIVKNNSETIVFEKACPLFVPLVENGYIDSENKITQLIVSEYLSEYRESRIDTILLGCTHYPILKEAICNVIPNVGIIEAGKEAAYKLKQILKDNGLNADLHNEGKKMYYVSDITENFTSICKVFLGSDIETIYHHKIE